MSMVFPLDNTEYTASAMGAWCATRTRGVFSSEEHFKVTADGTMTLTVHPGLAWMKMDKWWGCCFFEEESITLAVTPPVTKEKAVYAVTLRLDKMENKADIYIKTEAMENAKPLPLRNDVYEELIVAYVDVQRGQTSLASIHITDTRMNESLCGVMRDAVSGLPTAHIEAQACELLDMLKNELQGLNAGTEVMVKTAYDPQGTVLEKGGIEKHLTQQIEKYGYATQSELNKQINTRMPKTGGEFTGTVRGAAVSSASFAVRNTYFSSSASWPGGQREGDILAVYS